MTQEKELEYPSAKLLLTVVQKENDYEIDRKKTFETRAAIFVAFSGVLITLFVKILELFNFRNVTSETFFPFAITFTVLIFSIIFILASIYCFIHVLIAKSYDKLDLANFEYASAKLSEDQNSMFIMEMYRDSTISNRLKNDKKSRYFIVGIICIGLATLLVITCATISYFL